MKYVPESREASLFLSALHATAQHHPVPATLARAVLGESEDHVRYYGNNPSAGFKTANGRVALAFCRWIKALHDGNPAEAAKQDAEIDTATSGHPFPYKETRSWFGPASQGDIQYARDHYYRDWQSPTGGKGNQDFGVIEATVSPNAKIAIIGDWGTGTEDALYLFDDMMKREAGIEAVLHLGDIYQAGSALECAQNFLTPIEEWFEKNDRARVPVLTIPGNHEYYLMGQGFYSLIDVLNHDLPGWKQEASYFCLRSSDNKWQFLGADTGLGCIEHPTQPRLEPSELLWHRDKLSGFGGKTVFMTHHQFVSAFDALNKGLPAGNDLRYFNKRLLEQLGPDLDDLDLWLWGHDHWFQPYQADLPVPCSPTDVAQGLCQPGWKLKQGQLLGGSARHVKRAKSEHFNSGPHVVPEQTYPPDFNHTYGILDLGACTISYYQTPSWEDSAPSSIVDRANIAKPKVNPLISYSIT